MIFVDSFILCLFFLFLCIVVVPIAIYHQPCFIVDGTNGDDSRNHWGLGQSHHNNFFLLISLDLLG